MSTTERSHYCDTGFKGNIGDFLLGSGFGFLDHIWIRLPRSRLQVFQDFS